MFYGFYPGIHPHPKSHHLFGTFFSKHHWWPTKSTFPIVSKDASINSGPRLPITSAYRHSAIHARTFDACNSGAPNAHARHPRPSGGHATRRLAGACGRSARNPEARGVDALCPAQSGQGRQEWNAGCRNAGGEMFFLLRCLSFWLGGKLRPNEVK